MSTLPLPLPAQLDSPGAALAVRAAWESVLTGTTRREMRRFLASIERVSATGEAPSWPVVLAAWGALATALIEVVATMQGRSDALRSAAYDPAAPYLSPAPDSPDLSAQYAVLMDDQAPRLARDTVAAVLAVAAAQRWSATTRAGALRYALDPNGTTLAQRPLDPSTVTAPAGGEIAHPHDLPEFTVPGHSWAAMPQILARAAATSAYNSAVLERLAAGGYAVKRWVTRRDERVRPTHAAADGQIVPLGTEFIVGGYALMYPADLRAPAVETAGCRCVVTGA